MVRSAIFEDKRLDATPSRDSPQYHLHVLEIVSSYVALLSALGRSLKRGNAPKYSMGKRKVCLDLFCGLGGFSAAFEDSDEWEVVTVDIEERFGPDVCADVLDLRPADLLEAIGLDRGDIDVLVILASPPCTVFSTAGNHDLWDFDTKQPVAEPAREHVALAHHTVGLIRALAPDFWFLENPQGRLRWFLGRPAGSVTYCQYGRDYMKRTDLWGDHPPGFEYRKCKRNRPCHSKNVEYDGTSAVRVLGDDPAERALVPYELSESILDAVESAFAGEVREQVSVNDF